jgi:dienelactone hydrolase
MNALSALQLLGPSPSACDPDLEILESEDFGTYRRDKIRYKVELNDESFAYLLVPNESTKRRLPAVYCHHQHTRDRIGKTEVVGLEGNPDLAYAKELAERGYIAFAPDAFTFGDRRSGDDPSGYAYWEMSTRLVQGTTLLAKTLHDIRMGLNLLASLPEVDPDRIGFIGHSYGGRIAIWSAALDDRIQATVCNCGCISYSHSHSRDTGVQMEFVVQGIARELDMNVLIPMIAPRSLLLSGTEEDKWCRGMQQVYEQTRDAFDKDSLELRMYPGKHQFSKVMRDFSYQFLDRKLNHEPKL